MCFYCGLSKGELGRGREEEKQKPPRFNPKKKKVFRLHKPGSSSEGWGAPMGAALPQCARCGEKGAKNTFWTQFSMKLRMLGVGPGAPRGSFGGSSLSWIL